MSKQLSLRRGLSSILFWSIISAAFIGPGTVTTAAMAGASHGLQLLWALVFSIVGTIVLQEAAARLTIASGKSLGEVVALRYGRMGYWLAGAVIFGCAAYEAGNLLGALSGLALLGDVPRSWLLLLMCGTCTALLWSGNYQLIARLLGLVVFGMGLVFAAAAATATLPAFQWSAGALLPPGSAILAIGLIGTTIVPYNLFLASGIGAGQDLRDMRLGISLAVLIGGGISIAILITGTQVSGDFSFVALAAAINGEDGQWGAALLGTGLFAAGLSSAITAPLAAAVAAQSLVGQGRAVWSSQGVYFRCVWGGVLAVGLVFGVLDVRPIPAIIAAQAINGVLLPAVALFLFRAVNDRRLLPAQHLNGLGGNIAMLVVVGLVCLLGGYNLLRLFF